MYAIFEVAGSADVGVLCPPLRFVNSPPVRNVFARQSNAGAFTCRRGSQKRLPLRYALKRRAGRFETPHRLHCF